MKIHIMHTGEVCVSPTLPFGGTHCEPLICGWRRISLKK